MMIDDQVTGVCAYCRECLAAPGQAYCSAPCQQLAAHSSRGTPRADLVSAIHEQRVYACPVCATRSLGEDWCDACQGYRRSLGLGGLCPCCKEPVSLQDLLGSEMTLRLTY